MLLRDVGVEHAILFQIMGNGILGEKRRGEPDFGSDPFTLGVRSGGRMIASAAAAELRAEVGALDLVELLDLTPCFVAHGAEDIYL